MSTKNDSKSKVFDLSQVGHLIDGAKKGDFQALAQLLTWVERSGPELTLQQKDLLTPQSVSFRVGITGPPGAGKSTLIGELIRELRKNGLTVGVLAVDPSSPFSKGAILGDRIRYSEHFNDSGVYIRSAGTRGSLGGLSASAYLMLRAFDCARFDVVLVETVGVGQTELEIMNVADCIAVVLVPESGDSIQAMKAGLTEIADVFVVNKSDRPGAEGLKNELRATLELGENKKPFQIISTVATEQKGVQELMHELLRQKKIFDTDAGRSRLSDWRIKAEARSLYRWVIEDKILLQLEDIKSIQELAAKFKNISIDTVV